MDLQGYRTGSMNETIISIILTDLDGTLFRNDKSISDYTKQVIAEAQKKGILFGISTSRALVNASRYLIAT